MHTLAKVGPSMHLRSFPERQHSCMIQSLKACFIFAQVTAEHDGQALKCCFEACISSGSNYTSAQLARLGKQNSWCKGYQRMYPWKERRVSHFSEYSEREQWRASVATYICPFALQLCPSASALNICPSAVPVAKLREALRPILRFRAMA